MPSSMAHGLAALTVAHLAFPSAPPRYLYVSAAACAVLPDLDAIGRPFGAPDIQWLGGHRALTHSVAFAAALAFLVGAVLFRGAERRTRISRMICLAVATAMHGALDALTTYGDGVEFFAPFTTRRYKAPWQPLHSIGSEIVLVWLPALTLIWYLRRRAEATEN